MAIIYEETSDDSVVLRIETIDVQLQALVDEYLSLKAEYMNLPDWKKTVPDMDTLYFWNSEQQLLHFDLVHEIKGRAAVLLSRITPIYDAGLLPDRYYDEYDQLINFVNG